MRPKPLIPTRMVTLPSSGAPAGAGTRDVITDGCVRRCTRAGRTAMSLLVEIPRCPQPNGATDLASRDVWPAQTGSARRPGRSHVEHVGREVGLRVRDAQLG